MRPIPIEVKVQSCKDQTLRTEFETYNLTRNEVFVGKFKNQEQLNAFIDINVIRFVTPSTDIVKPVPVILRDETGKRLSLSSIPEEISWTEPIESVVFDEKTGVVRSFGEEFRTEPLSLVEMNAMLAE